MILLTISNPDRMGSGAFSACTTPLPSGRSACVRAARNHTAPCKPGRRSVQGRFLTIASSRRPKGGQRRKGGTVSIGDFSSMLGEGVLETLWPTRCCICDSPGKLVCEACETKLEHVDYWRACPRCGGPLGFVQCTECNLHSLRSLGRERYPFDSCTSPFLLNDAARTIVVAWKDKGEERLARFMACAMADCLPPLWRSGRPGDARLKRIETLREEHVRTRSTASERSVATEDPRAIGPPQAVFYIPATGRAKAQRGFDHAELLARSLADLLGLPCWTPLARPSARDQRSFGRRERSANARKSFRPIRAQRKHAEDLASGRMRELPESIVLVDDVFTTGTTLSEATDALHALGIERVHATTFARRWAYQA